MSEPSRPELTVEIQGEVSSYPPRGRKQYQSVKRNEDHASDRRGEAHYFTKWY
jgi:hypothetical protein